MFTHQSASEVKVNISSTTRTHLIRGAFCLLLFAGMCVIPLALGQRKVFVTSSNSDQVSGTVTVPQTPTIGVLWDQYDNPATQPPVNIGSQEFEPAMAAFSDQAADDFIVTGGPSGFGMCITSVRVMGEYSKGGGAASSFNVYI